VRVVENGVPAPTPWYASVGSKFYTTTADNISLMLPSGSYPIASVGIPLPIGGKELNPSERLGPFAASPAYVSGAHSNITIQFVDQWGVNVTASPVEGGTVSPDVGWWNASQPLALTAVPTLGYAFQGWSGWGSGSYNGSSRSITVVPTGRITEKARFGVGTQVVFFETGLPTGTPWSLTIRGLSTNSSTNLLDVYEMPGSYGFSVDPVPGYRILPANGGFTITGSYPQFVGVKFVALTPPQPSYAVAFLTSGLPTSTPVLITVRNATQTAGLGDPQVPAVFQLLNGTYAYRLGYVAGYHANVPVKTFVVPGGPTTVVVPFVPTVYRATWAASGMRADLHWGLVVNDQWTAATSSWLSVTLTNGTYPYQLELSTNYSATPRTGVLVIAGAAVLLPVTFAQVQFPLLFQASGPGASGAWSVRFGSLTQGASGSASTFLAANGTYTYDVHPPSGSYAVPSHGSLVVAGPSAPIPIQFHPSSLRPSAALVAALTSGALSASAWIGASIFVGFAAVRGLGRRDG
ncbi:MAG: hypothetical protein L3J73_02000, partial [Thermoplasmata archaeon]|nr:hypothetical protein [Thermoplasmata archaeon]